MNREEAIQLLKKELSFTKVDFIPGQLITVQGKQKRLVYLLESGWVKLSEISEDGKVYSVDICAPGTFLGLPILFTEQAMRLTITAMTACRLQAVKRGDLESFLLQHPQVMAILFAELGETVAKVMRAKIVAVQENSLGQVRDLLIHFADCFGISVPGGRLIPVNLTQQEIADFIGLSRVRVGICLKSLIDIGFIRRERKYYVLSDYPQENCSNNNPRYTEYAQ